MTGLSKPLCQQNPTVNLRSVTDYRLQQSDRHTRTSLANYDIKCHSQKTPMTVIKENNGTQKETLHENILLLFTF